MLDNNKTMLFIYIITISLLILNVGLLSFFKTNHYKHDQPVGCFILYDGIKYMNMIKKTVL